MGMVEADPKILEAAQRLFRQKGYHAVVLADIATEAEVALPAVQTHYPHKEAVLQALLQQHDPRQKISRALSQLRGDNAEEAMRGAIEQLLIIFDEHDEFASLLLMDAYINNGQYLEAMLADLASESASFINRLSTMPGIRPISTVMLGRMLSSVLIGFIATQQLAPTDTRFAMRIFPRKAWVDGLSDMLLHGILED